MPLTRRNFLISGSLSLAAGALSPLLVQAEKAKPSTPTDFGDWESVRQEFELAPDYIHLALFYLASHPRPVRQAIEQYRAKIDANPFVALTAQFSNRLTRTFRSRFAVPLAITSAATRRTSR